MNHSVSCEDSQPVAGVTKKDDLLERQLERLFSDVVAPEPGGTFGRPPRAARKALQQTGVSAPAPKSQRVHKKQLFKLLSATVTRSLGALAPFMVLVFMVAERAGFAWSIQTATPSAATPQAIAYEVSVTDTPAPPPPTPTVKTPTATPVKPSATSATPTASRPTFTAAPTPPVATQTPGAAPATATTAPATHTPTLSEVPATHTPILLPTAAPAATLTRAPEATPTPNATPTTDPSPLTPSRLFIPAINLEAPIDKVGFIHYIIGGQPVSTWAVPERFAVGWHHTSALPGQVGNTVLNGHQNIHGGVFRDLNKLQAGDEILVYVGNAAYRYRVAERHLLAEEGQPLEVRIENARWIMPTQDERLTLVTCAPDTRSTHRLIVVAFPVDQ